MAYPTPKAGPTALERFLHHKARIDRAIERIQAASDDHFGINPDECHWGHVADLEFVADRIDAAVTGFGAN